MTLHYGTEQMNTGWNESSDSPPDYSLQQIDMRLAHWTLHSVSETIMEGLVLPLESGNHVQRPHALHSPVITFCKSLSVSYLYVLTDTLPPITAFLTTYIFLLFSVKIGSLESLKKSLQFESWHVVCANSSIQTPLWVTEPSLVERFLVERGYCRLFDILLLNELNFIVCRLMTFTVAWNASRTN